MLPCMMAALVLMLMVLMQAAGHMPVNDAAYGDVAAVADDDRDRDDIDMAKLTLSAHLLIAVT